MGGSDSKTPSEDEPPIVETDGLLKLLQEASKKKQDEYKASIDEINIKLAKVELEQKVEKSSIDTSALILKSKKLQFKLDKLTEQDKLDTDFIAAVRKIYSELKDAKTTEVGNLKLIITALKADKDDLTAKIKEQEDLHQIKEQQYILESCEQTNIIAELKKRAISNNKLDNYLPQVRALTMEMETLRREHEKYQQSTEATLTTLRTSNSNFNLTQSKQQQEIMCLKTKNQQLIKQQQTNESKYDELLRRGEQSTEDSRKKISALNNLLTSTVILTTGEQKNTLTEVKKSLQGLKNDLQFLIPSLNHLTIPTVAECSKEMGKLNALLARNEENLNKVDAFEGSFDTFVKSKQPMTGLENIPNLLSGIEIPCSFLHLKFLPLFRITFSTIPRPLLGPFNNLNYNVPKNQKNENKTAKSRQSVPRPANQRGVDNESKRTLTQRTKQNTNANSTRDKQMSADANDNNNDWVSSSGVVLTVLTNAGASGVTQKLGEVKKRPQQTDCVICGESLKMPIMPVKMLDPCMHIYHKSCINEWYDSNTECPICAMED